jgi:hypothetical protein
VLEHPLGLALHHDDRRPGDHVDTHVHLDRSHVHDRHHEFRCAVYPGRDLGRRHACAERG